MRALAIASLAIASLTAFAFGCSDDPPASHAKATSMTVWTFDEPVLTGASDTPLGGVEIALDPPGGGKRVMLRTEADGHVTFEADFTGGGARVTALSADHTLVTRLDVSPDSVAADPNTFGKPERDLVIVLPRLDRAAKAGTVELRGNLTGKQAASHLVDIAASSLGRASADTTDEPAYELRAPQGRPFFLLGHELGTEKASGEGVTIEHFKSFRIDVSARDADGVLDVDVASTPAAPTRIVHLRAAPPSSSAFAAGAKASVTALSADSMIIAAPFTKRTRAADGQSFDLEMTLADVDVAPERLITQATIIAADGSFSRRSEIGVAADGTSWTDFLAPPVIPEASRALADPIPLDDFPPGAELRIEVFANGQLVWLLHGPPPHEKSLVLPIPFGLELSADVQLFALSIGAESDRVALPPHGNLYRRVAFARDVIVRRR